MAGKHRYNDLSVVESKLGLAGGTLDAFVDATADPLEPLTDGSYDYPYATIRSAYDAGHKGLYMASSYYDLTGADINDGDLIQFVFDESSIYNQNNILIFQSTAAYRLFYYGLNGGCNLRNINVDFQYAGGGATGASFYNCVIEGTFNANLRAASTTSPRLRFYDCIIESRINQLNINAESPVIDVNNSIIRQDLLNLVTSGTVRLNLDTSVIEEDQTSSIVLTNAKYGLNGVTLDADEYLSDTVNDIFVNPTKGSYLLKITGGDVVKDALINFKSGYGSFVNETGWDISTATIINDDLDISSPSVVTIKSPIIRLSDSLTQIKSIEWNGIKSFLIDNTGLLSANQIAMLDTYDIPSFTLYFGNFAVAETDRNAVGFTALNMLFGELGQVGGQGTADNTLGAINPVYATDFWCEFRIESK